MFGAAHQRPHSISAAKTILAQGGATMNVQQFLDKHRAEYVVLMHPAEFNAQRIAHAVHVPGEQVAKTVLLKADKGFKYVMAVLPATHHVDLERVKQAIGAGEIELASEVDVAAHCVDCEVGAMPPFGSQMCIETLVDESLAHAVEIVFEGNSHNEAIRMKYRDYYDLEHPLVVQISRHD
jgi:Ala-tRNA(Pro) deacylase